MMKLIPALTDDERFPLLKQRQLLEQLRQDSCAPIFNFASGDRLHEGSLQKVHDYAKEIKAKRFWKKGELPDWLNKYFQWCRGNVPFYRELPDDFAQAPSLRREQIAAQPWKFVANDADLDELLVYSTSGTTGVPMKVLFDPISQAAWIPQLESILAEDGIEIRRGSDQVAVCLVCNQQETLTYASLSTYLEGAGVLKINLNPADWKNQADCVTYLEKYNPQILTGDPFTFESLLALKPRLAPKAIVSTAMILGEAFAEKLKTYFKCPVYDVYSLTECRMIAVSISGGVHRLIRPDLYLEIMHPQRDQILGEGEAGEIVVTGGINPFLPLIRYRTGDFAALKHQKNRIELVNFSGRSQIRFIDARGSFVNNVDISRALCKFALAAFSLHQNKDRQVEFVGWSSDVGVDEVKKTLISIFGKKLIKAVEIKTSAFDETTKVRYSSDIDSVEFEK